MILLRKLENHKDSGALLRVVQAFLVCLWRLWVFRPRDICTTIQRFYGILKGLIGPRSFLEYSSLEVGG